VKAVFVELPPFERYRPDYLDDEALSVLQGVLMNDPEAGERIQGAGGLRKMLYDKDEMSDLTAKQRRDLKAMLQAELQARRVK
jgi:hypothetical protein